MTKSAAGGRVFLAHDRHIGRDVAIKELLGGVRESWNRRFLRQPSLKIQSRSPVEAVALSPDGRTVLLGDNQRVIVHPVHTRVLQQDPARLLERAQRSVGLQLSGFRLAPARVQTGASK